MMEERQQNWQFFRANMVDFAEQDIIILYYK